MSYTLTTPCFACKKASECTDEKNIQQGVNVAHGSGQSHQGGGDVQLMCVHLEIRKPG